MTKTTAVEARPMRRDDVMQMLGAAKYAEWLQQQSGSHVIQFLMTVEDEKLYLEAGHETFAGFLDASGLKSKSAFYRARELYLKEGPDQYDLFTSWRVPMNTRRLLESGDIAIDGDEVVIAGQERISLTNSGSIKAILEQLVKEKIGATKAAAESTTKLERTTRRLEAEQAVCDDLRTEIAELNERTPFEVALSDLLISARQFCDIVTQLDPDDRHRRAKGDVQSIRSLVADIEDAYGIARWQEMMAKVEANGGPKK